MPDSLPKSPRRLVAYSDGASRGNPGPAAFGAVILDEDGHEVSQVSQAIGRATNNVAEYRGAIAALRAALALRATALELRMDSELIVRQVQGRYRVRSAALRPLYDELRALIDTLDDFQVSHVPRERNQRADALANAALDGRGTIH